MVACGSNVAIHQSIFNENSAKVVGGVIMSYNGTVSVGSTMLTNYSVGTDNGNRAPCGVMMTYEKAFQHY